MAIKYGFFNSVDGDRKYTAEDIGRYLQGIISSGVYADSSDSLQVVAGGGMNVIVQPGRAMLDFHYMENDSPLTLTLSPSGSLPRKDTIVMRLNNLSRLCEIAVVEGTPATSPVANAPKRTDAVKEYVLAIVTVNKLVTAISDADIRDERSGQYCRWVTGVIKQVDTSTLFNQWQAAYEAAAASLTAYMETKQAEFDAWFNALTEELNVNTYVQEYTNAITLEVPMQSIYIGINDYNPEEDVLLVNVGGIIWPQSNYAITGTAGAYMVYFRDTTLKAGDLVEFRVFKSKIGSAANANATVLALDEEGGSVLTSGGSTLALEN